MRHDTETQKASALVEALPFIQQHRGQTFVIKYGGSAMEDEQLVGRTLRDVVFLEAVGIRPVLVHGGGKAITSRMRDAGLKARFVQGLRVTDAAAMALVERTLDTVINPMIVAAIGEFRGRAVGLPGRGVFRASRLPPQPDAQGEPVDLGFVGEVSGVNLDAVQAALSDGSIPVISPVGLDGGGAALNVNADVAAGALAAALRAAKLIFISDVRGLMRDPTQEDSLIPSVNAELIGKLIRDGIIEGGMIPKAESAAAALAAGVGKAHFIDGRLAHSLLLEVLTNSGVGTEIVP